MKIPELLAPAGSFEALIAAVAGGCDAVYLAGNRFGARAFADNFDEEQIINAVKYCHIRDVKVYVTVNTLIYEDELEAAMGYIDFLYCNDVDALIIQDLGLLEWITKCYPDFELHASTQMHVHNLKGVELLQEYGVKRVVLAREYSLDLIKTCTNQGIEIEVFVQGALCVCYSGQCLMSSIVGNRSGNRGECAQPCRLPYRLIEESENKEIMTEGHYLLSPKDLNSLNHISELMEAGIDSFKIEGRMKRPEYVGLVVSLWRRAIDEYCCNKKQSYNQADEKNLLKVFNRGFTNGYLFNQFGLKLMNPFRPNHMGIQIGVVEQAGQDKIKIRLSEELAQQDGIRILGKNKDVGFAANKIFKNDYLVNRGNKGDVIELACTDYIEKGSVVLKTSDVHQLQDIQENIIRKIKRIPIRVEVIAHIDQPLILIITDGVHSIKVHSDMKIIAALKSPVSHDKIKTIIAKCKDTPYFIESIQIDSHEAIFISLQVIGELRRRSLEELSSKRACKYGDRKKPLNYKEIQNDLALKDDIIVIHTKAQFEELSATGYQNFYLADESYYHELKKKHEKIYFRYPRVHEQSEYIESKRILIQDLGALKLYEDHPYMLADAAFNVTNSYALTFLYHHHIKGVVLSHEMNDAQIKATLIAFENRTQQKACVGRMNFGYREVMVSKNCVINTLLKGGEKENCRLCKANKLYVLCNEKNDRFKVMTDASCFNHLLETTRLKRSGVEGVWNQNCYTIENNEEMKVILREKKNEKNF